MFSSNSSIDDHTGCNFALKVEKLNASTTLESSLFMCGIASSIIYLIYFNMPNTNISSTTPPKKSATL